MQRAIFRAILFALAPMLNRAAGSKPAFKAMLSRHNIIAQIQLKDGSIGRHLRISNGRVSSVAGIHSRPDVALIFKDVRTALAMMKPNPDMGEVVHAAKNFKVQVIGPDSLAVWLMQTLNMMQTSALQFGTPMPDGTTRYTNITNGGPLFVYVRDGRIVRLTPIDFDDKDAASWTIRHAARPRWRRTRWR
jgi:hypothetical protein